MELVEHLYRERMRPDAGGKSYQGLEHLDEISERTPVVFITSHKEHNEQSPIGSEPRHLANLVDAMPGDHRKIRLITRKESKLAGRVKQAISPIHTVIATPVDTSNLLLRYQKNRVVMSRLASEVKKQHGSVVIAIAPDAGQTPASSPYLVDPEKVSAGGVFMLVRALNEQGFTEVPIIPVAFDHHSGLISVGKDCSQAFSQASRDEKAQVLARAINEAAI
jgi:hypothetical protein